MNELVRFYWYLLVRRAPVMIAVVALFVVLAAAFAINQPNKYSATAHLLVERPQIPDELAASTVNTEAGEELQIIEQRMTTRAILLGIANEFKVFEDEAETLSPDETAAAMAEALEVRSIVRRNAPMSMDISFTAQDPETAAAVVNELVTRVLDDNVRVRTERAGNTLDFFEQEVRQLSEELAKQSARISEYKSENSETLPEALQFRLNREAALDERLLALSRERSSIDEQRERVISVYQETGQLSTPEVELTPEQRQLRDLETQLASALAIYSESNPRVAVLRTRIDQLRRVVAGQGTGGETRQPSSSVYDVTLAELEARASSLDNQIADVTEELDELRTFIAETPRTAIALEQMDRDYRNVRLQYDAAVSRLATARTGEQIELTAQGRRISVVESAVPPEWPTSPNRTIITAAGGLAGVAAAATLFALLELLNNKIRRPAELVSRVGVTPLATIPYIETRGQQVRRRSLQALALVVFFVILPATLIGVHLYVMPLADVLQQAKDSLSGMGG